MPTEPTPSVPASQEPRRDDNFVRKFGFSLNPEGFYSAEAKCQNCHRNQRIAIRKGITAAAIAEEIVCENCGCKEHIVPDTNHPVPVPVVEPRQNAVIEPAVKPVNAKPPSFEKLCALLKELDSIFEDARILGLAGKSTVIDTHRYSEWTVKIRDFRMNWEAYLAAAPNVSREPISAEQWLNENFPSQCEHSGHLPMQLDNGAYYVVGKNGKHWRISEICEAYARAAARTCETKEK